MMKTYVDLDEALILETPCPACDGSGVIYCDTWAEWRKEYDAGNVGPMPSCGEEHACGECYGASTILTPLGQQIVDMLAKRFKLVER